MLLTACGGDDADPEEDTSTIVSDMPPRVLNNDSDIVADPTLGRLVYATFAADSQPALDLLSRYFSTRASFTKADDLQSGDVLVIDGRTVTPSDMGNADQLAAKAFAAQVPIIVVGFDEALENAVHQLLPTASLPGFNSLALITPPRPSQGWNDGGIMLTASQDDTSITVTRNTADQVAAKLLDFRNQRGIAAQAALAASTKSEGGDSSQCSASDPAYCNYVQQVALGSISIADNSKSNCLSRDWSDYDNANNDEWSRTYTGYIAAPRFDFFAAQCPSQTWNFFPVLYLTYSTDPATGKLTQPSRVLYLGMNGSFNAKVADQNAGLFGWFQTRRSLEVLPDPSFVLGGDNITKKGLKWLDNTPKTQNGQTTQSDTAGWSLSAQFGVGVGGCKPPTGSADLGWG
ncbi:MAG TPA: hypothetical protein VGC24_04960, partial [Burkholderiaceae bacterium]